MSKIHFSRNLSRETEKKIQLSIDAAKSLMELEAYKEAEKVYGNTLNAVIDDLIDLTDKVADPVEFAFIAQANLIRIRTLRDILRKIKKQSKQGD